VDARYDTYCAVDPLFYDALTNTKAPTKEYGGALSTPDGWQHVVHADWLIYAPDGSDLPQQGWKIHVSATLATAERVLGRVWEYCVPRALGFKFLRGPQMLLMRNAKYASRGSSGKFITIYPHDEAELELVCKELAELLDGEPGPYILSDLRYGAGPVYVRYGGFAARYCLSEDGQVIPAIADADGTLVPDRRDPVFHVPDWVSLPGFLVPELAARNATSTNEVPYQIDRVLHFSNGGGLYVGRDTRTDETVVLKEGRPHAGLDGTGVDALTRVRHEREVLLTLAGIEQVPRVHDAFQLGDHEFLALEHIDGLALNKALVERYPLADPAVGRAELEAYTVWALDVHRQVQCAMAAVHERGIVHGDLHLFNIMVRPDDRIVLIDFEVAAPASDAARPALRNQAFAAPRDRVGFAVDEYALACLRLALFLPLTSMVRPVPAKAAHLADVIAEQFPVPRAFLDEAVRVITGQESNGTDARLVGFDPDDWPGLRRQLAGAVLASATPAREDRLFPGDIEQFRSGGLNLAYGAAGVLWALSASGAGRYPEHEEWLASRAVAPASGTCLGFYDGLHGVAYALQHLGRPEQASKVLEICLGEPWRELNTDLASGLAGVGLNLAYFAGITGDAALRDAAREAAQLVADRLDAVDSDSAISGGQHPYAGLTRGGAGPALLFLRLYETTGDPGLLDLAAQALRRDLRRCVVGTDGALGVNEGWRTMPYLAHGSVGIGLVLDQYLGHRDDDEFRTASTAIRLAARSPFYAQSGLFAGRAGIVAYLAARRGARPDEAGEDNAELDRQLRRLAWHALPYQNFLAFPGEQLLRLSMDLATGTAGVLFAIAMARHDPPVTLPFLTPLPGAEIDGGHPATYFRRAEDPSLATKEEYGHGSA
jgi:tRNA A-37 threonylcarbamoyl transferase component Bud32